jgi:energy-coupling factor transporter ATP-binding protein EcfA2
MISFSNINKQYGKQLLFVDASFQLNPGEKVGLVGPNGAGKTTLFRMVVGEETPDEGAVSVPKKLTVAPHISRTLRRQAPPKHRRQQRQGNRRNQRPGPTTYSTQTTPSTYCACRLVSSSIATALEVYEGSTDNASRCQSENRVARCEFLHFHAAHEVKGLFLLNSLNSPRHALENNFSAHCEIFEQVDVLTCCQIKHYSVLKIPPASFVSAAKP